MLYSSNNSVKWAAESFKVLLASQCSSTVVKLKTYARCIFKLELALLNNSKGTTAQGSPMVQAAARNPRLATHVLQQGCILHSSQRHSRLTVGKVPSHCLLEGEQASQGSTILLPGCDDCCDDYDLLRLRLQQFSRKDVEAVDLQAH